MVSDRVAAWLEELSLGQYAEIFADNAIDEHILRDLTDVDLKELGVTALGHRKTLLGITPGSGKSERQRAADEALDDGRLTGHQAVFVNDLLDLPQPTEQRALYDAMDNSTRSEGRQRVMSCLLTAASNRQALLPLIEDVHWADASTLAHLCALQEALSSV